MKYLKILLGMMMCVFLFSCKNEENNFEGSWKLISYEKDGIAQVIADSTLNISFEKKNIVNISGNAGVNDFMATIGLNDGAIESFSEIVTTRMAGDPEVMQFESELLQTLSGADVIEVDIEENAKYLVITNTKEKSILKYQFQTSQKWTVEALFSDDELENISTIENKPYLILYDNGDVAGSTGINLINMTFKIDESKNEIKFSEGPMTLIAGDDASSKIETSFLNNLIKTEYYEESGNNLVFLSKDGTVLIQFVKD